MLIFIAGTFILLIFIRNFINLQGSEGFHDLLALVMMDLQDPTMTNPIQGFTSST